MNINELLNPSCGNDQGYRGSGCPTPVPFPGLAIPTPSTRRQKVPKDAPIFSEGNKVVGYVNFPPYEARTDQELGAHHRRFNIYPLGEIYKKGVRHIPYNSDKKDFLDKTGRDSFEMFQYTYKRPGEEKEYVVVWDYNVGLVRMTPFFKSCKYSKTVPAKAMKENPGLRQISYSITGGALVCQGYWMPYHAARALAATFCHDIRWALTPVFGNDFPSICIRPDEPRFAKFLIDPEIVQFCTQETHRFLEEGPSYCVRTLDAASPVETTETQLSPLPASVHVLNQQRGRPADIESGYGTDTDQSDKYFNSPGVCLWTSVNRSPSPYSTRTVNSSTTGSPVSDQTPHMQFPTSNPGEYHDESLRTKRTHSKVAYGDDWDGEVPVRPQTAISVDSGQGPESPVGEEAYTNHDIAAAECLLFMSVAGSTMPPTKRTRRASSI